MPTEPSPPLNHHQVDSSATTSSVRLQWNAPDRPNGNITHFKVTYDMHAFRNQPDMVVYRPSFSTFPSPPPSLPLSSPSPPFPPHLQVYYQKRSSRQYQVSDWQGQGYVVLDGLDPNTEYYVNVTAVTDTFESDASNGLRVVTLPVAASATPATATGVCVSVNFG